MKDVKRLVTLTKPGKNKKKKKIQENPNTKRIWN
jgi:hypothetical protein